MPPATPTPAPLPTPPTPAPTPPPAPKGERSFAKLKKRANTVTGVVVLLVAILIGGTALGYLFARSKHAAPAAKAPSVQTLTPAEISKLTQVGTSLGSSGQTLNIGADSIFGGKVGVGGALAITGQLSANGPVVLSQLNVTGASATSSLSVAGNLGVAGTTVLQKSLTANDLVTINNSLAVSGPANFGALSASTITVKSISITGPIVVGHFQTQGGVPGASAGGGIGGGGTVSVSGNDAAGTINMNTGGGPSAGVLMSVSFRAAYSAAPHILLTALTSAATTTPVFITKTATGFQIHAAAAPPAGTTLSYDYFVTQ